jgi:hypothetical protein
MNRTERDGSSGEPPEDIFDFDSAPHEPLVPAIQQGVSEHFIERSFHGFARRLGPQNLLGLADLCRINQKLRP